MDNDIMLPAPRTTPKYGINFLEMLRQLRQERRSFAACGREIDLTKNQVAGLCWRQGWCIRKSEPAPPPARFEFPDPDTCFWPIGHPGAVGFHFCGEALVTGKPFCSSHCAIAYVVPKDKLDAA